MHSHSYECVCGVVLNAASDRGLETALAKHNRLSNIHKQYMEGK